MEAENQNNGHKQPKRQNITELKQITNYSPTVADANNEYRHLNSIKNKDYIL